MVNLRVFCSYDAEVTVIEKSSTYDKVNESEFPLAFASSPRACRGYIDDKEERRDRGALRDSH